MKAVHYFIPIYIIDREQINIFLYTFILCFIVYINKKYYICI